MHETSTHRPSPRACTLGGVLPSTPVDPSKPLVDVQQHHILKPGANKCRLRDFPHANKCDLLNLEILQLIQLSWGIEDFSSAFFSKTLTFWAPKGLPKTFLQLLGPLAPIKTEANAQKMENSQLVLTFTILAVFKPSSLITGSTPKFLV